MPGQGRLTLDLVFTPEPAVVAQTYFVTAERARALEQPMWKAIEQVVIPEIDLNFQSEGRPSPWPALAKSTLLKKKGTPKILQETFDLIDAVTSKHSYVVYSSGSVVTGLLVDIVGYGHFHLTGRAHPPMPVRDFVYMGEAALDEIEQIMADWILENEF